jgi:chloride channel 3/4/5
MTEMMEILFRECEGDYDYDELCEAKNRWSLILSLSLATVIRTLFVILSYGCKVPAGIFVPSMAIGASFGRMVGIFVQALHESYPNSTFFSACAPDVPCITPGTYAFLGAGAALSGIMHITVSVVVIMFELTGALTYILPTMVSHTILAKQTHVLMIIDRRRRDKGCKRPLWQRWHSRSHDLVQRLPFPRQ